MQRAIEQRPGVTHNVKSVEFEHFLILECDGIPPSTYNVWELHIYFHRWNASPRMKQLLPSHNSGGRIICIHWSEVSDLGIRVDQDAKNIRGGRECSSQWQVEVSCCVIDGLETSRFVNNKQNELF